MSAPNNHRLLLIEDDLVDQMAFTREAKTRNFPFDFEIASSLTKARSMLAESEYDLVITDFHLGDGTGFELLQDPIDIPVIFVTGGGGEEMAVKAMKHGAYDYLIKDSDRNYLKLLPVTVRKALDHFDNQRKLKISDQRYRELFEGTSDMIQSVNREGKYLYVNRAWREALGYTNEELAELTAFDIIHPDAHYKFHEVIPRLFAEGKLIEIGCQFVAKDGRVLEVKGNIQATMDGGQMATRGVFHDVTSEVEAERKLIEANERLEQKVEVRTAELAASNRYLTRKIDEYIRAEQKLMLLNDELSTLIYKISHDIRSPLTSVLGLANLGRMQSDPDGELVEYFDMIEERIVHLDEILQQLTNVSRFRDGGLELEVIALDEIVEEVLTAIQPLPGYRPIEIRTRFQLGQPYWGEKGPLTTILQNLIINAIKYQDEEELQPFLNLTVSSDTQGVTIIAEDNGIGLEEKDKDKLFEMFFRGTAQVQGSGLGLYITRKAAFRLGGTIVADGEPGQPTRFTVTLPHLDPQSGQAVQYSKMIYS